MDNLVDLEYIFINLCQMNGIKYEKTPDADSSPRQSFSTL